MTKFLGDTDAMAKVSAGFSKRYHGVLQGAIGAIDGWLVRIVRPNFKRDGIKNIMIFFLGKDSIPSMFNALLMTRNV